MQLENKKGFKPKICDMHEEMQLERRNRSVQNTKCAKCKVTLGVSLRGFAYVARSGYVERGQSPFPP